MISSSVPFNVCTVPLCVLSDSNNKKGLFLSNCWLTKRSVLEIYKHQVNSLTTAVESQVKGHRLWLSVLFTNSLLCTKHLQYFHFYNNLLFKGASKMVNLHLHEIYSLCHWLIFMLIALVTYSLSSMDEYHRFKFVSYSHLDLKWETLNITLGVYVPWVCEIVPDALVLLEYKQSALVQPLL